MLKITQTKSKIMNVKAYLSMLAFLALFKGREASAQTTGAQVGDILVKDLMWLVTGGGILTAVFGIIALINAGRAQDAQGKSEAGWFILGGILLAAVGGGSMLSGVFSNPPGN
ncbi:hypothetical protein [Lactococcus petauri]|jgi:hypothetical protein|nr:hypothetical protein [Lactococcus petauri]